MDSRSTASAPALTALPPFAPLAATTRSASPVPAHPDVDAAPSVDAAAVAAVQSAQTQPLDTHEQRESRNPISALLGTPDRAATASAPPDLEISSRSLFAFKAGYSGIFSDIRHDDYYESFYRENPERLNLPPPLPNPNSASASSVLLSRAEEAHMAHRHQLQRHQQQQQQQQQQQIAPQAQRFLHCDDSDASINDLIYQETESARLDNTATHQDSSLYQAEAAAERNTEFSHCGLDLREEVTSVVSHTAHQPQLMQKGKSASARRPPQQPLSQPQPQEHTHHSDHRPQQHVLEPRYAIQRHPSPRPREAQNVLAQPPLSASPPPQLHQQNQLQEHIDTASASQDRLPHLSPPPPSTTPQPQQQQQRSQSHRSTTPSLQQHSARHTHDWSELDPHDSHAHQISKHLHHQPPQQHRYLSHAQRHQPQAALWSSLNQLTLEDNDSVPSTHSPRRMYPAANGAYQPNTLRAPYENAYVYPQPESPLDAQLTGQANHLFDSPPQQHWSHQRGVGSSGSHELNGIYDPRFDSVVPPPGLDQYLYKSPDEAFTMSSGLAHNVDGSLHGAAPSVLSYANSGVGGRGLYQPQHQRNLGASHLSGRSGGGGRNNGRSRSHHSGHGSNTNTPFNYLYGSRAAANVVVPSSASEYLNVQAAAAAAAAAAAVYKSGGVHINGSGPGPLPSFAGSGMSNRSMGIMSPMRGGKSGDARRGGGASHDSYGRGSLKFGMGGDHRESFTRGSSGRSGDFRNGIEDSYNGTANSAAGGSGSSGGSGGNSKFSSFNDIIGRAEELARDQHGCRFLQTKLEEGNTMYINSIFEECYEKFVDLMTDPFGNYLCQKLFEHCNDSQRLALVERCAPAFPRVSTNMHGTRAVQRMVECLSKPEQVEAVCKALAPAAVALMKDINGNHVIQRCLHRMDPAHNQFVYDAVANNCFELATHRHGCCVMQRCMDFASPAQRNQLAKQINANALPLVQNAFGNYVVQYVLDLNDPTYTAEIIRRLRGHLAELSMQKFSSNAVEKGLKQGPRELRQELIFELIEDPDTMRRLLHDAYGNYVIQSALQIAESPQLEQICEAIRPHLNSLRQSPYGKRIQAKIQKRMPKGLRPSIASI